MGAITIKDETLFGRQNRYKAEEHHSKQKKALVPFRLGTAQKDEKKTQY